MKRPKLILSISALAATLMTMTSAHAAWVAYDDFGEVSALPGNVTTHTTGAGTVTTTAGPVALIQFSDGAATGAFLEVTGFATDNNAGDRYDPPPGGSAGDPLFNGFGLGLETGSAFGNGSTIGTFTFTGLDPGQHYDIAFVGSRKFASDGVERFTISGVGAAPVNASSVGAVDAFTADQDFRGNPVSGDVVRWTKVSAGLDGIATVTVDPSITAPLNVAYVMAARIEETAPTADVWTAYHDIEGTSHTAVANTTSQNTADATTGLVKFADGSATGVSLTIDSQAWDGRGPTTTFGPDSGTLGDAVFSPSGLDLDNGFISSRFDVGGEMTFGFTGLDPTGIYEVALYGHRNFSSDGLDRFILSDVDSALNNSSGVISGLQADFDTRQNAIPPGEAAYFTNIATGADGDFLITVSGVSGSNIAYINGVALARVGTVPTPAALPAGLAMLGLAAMRRRRMK